MSRTDLEEMQHRALAEVGMLLQDDHGKWKLRGDTRDHIRAAMVVTGALKAYHSADAGWVACAERMPPKGRIVIAFIPQGDGNWNMKTLPSHGDCWWGLEEWAHQPTHWRPLPAPPAAEITAEKPEGRA